MRHGFLARPAVPSLSAVALTVVGLVLWAYGVPNALPLVAAVVLSASRLARRMSWAAATASAIVLVLLAEVVLLAACAAVRPGRGLSPAAAAVVLAGPVLLSCYRSRAGDVGDRRAGRRGPSWLRVSAVGSGPVLFVLAVSGSRLRSTTAPIAWAMGDWDARNHVLLARRAISGGGLNLELLDRYPILVNAITAAVADAPGRGRLAGGALLRNDVTAQAWVWGLGVALTGLLAGLLAGQVTAGLPSPVGLVATGLGSLTAISGIVLGAALSAGFVTATWGIVLLQCLLVFGTAWWRDRPELVATAGAWTGFLAVGVWTFVAAPAMLLAAAAGYRALRGGRPARSLVPAGGGVLVTVALLVHLAGAYAFGMVAMPTMIEVIPLPIVAVVAVLATATVRFGSPAARPGAGYALGAVIGALAVSLAGMALRGAPLRAYYPMKLAWMTASALLPWACAAGPVVVLRLSRSAARRGGYLAPTAAGSFLLLTLWSTPQASPVLPWWSAAPGRWPVRQVTVWGGPSTPSDEVVGMVLDLGRGGDLGGDLGLGRDDARVLFVEYWRGYQDRDANLWVSALNDDGGPEPSSPHGADIWDAASACRFLATHPSYRALTRDPGVAAQLQVCAPSASGHADGTRSMPS